DQIQNPPERIIEHGGFERISDELTFFAGRDELGVFEQIEVIRNARRSHLERLADLADGEIVFLEHLKDAPAGGVAKSFEEEVQFEKASVIRPGARARCSSFSDALAEEAD